MTLSRRHFLTVAAAAVAVGSPAAALPVPLDAISSYFNALETLRAGFTQYNADGSRSTGRLYIRRPGRARFEYDPPDRALVMAGGGQLAIFDGASNTGRPEQYPLSKTPLNVILERKVDLARREAIVSHSGTPEATTVVAMDPDNPDYGRIAMVFGGSPVQLIEWTTQDASGAQTRVVLNDLQTGLDLPSDLFNITLEIRKRGG